MFLSQREIDRIVNDGGIFHYEYWVYDILANRLEETGFKRRTPLSDGEMVGSLYSKNDDHMVFLLTDRTRRDTFIRSVPYPKPEESST